MKVCGDVCLYVCVCVSQSLSASQCAALPQLTYFSVVQIQVYVREINFDFVSLRFVFMPMRGLHTHTHTDRGICVCVVCANKVGQGMTACVKEREGEREKGLMLCAL